ncbi:hypothetical protein HDU67_006854 [Dinochytrium kinnereticum]|nr:hypothetical protein HDU67_006854 [Dinochytrium kinnereticum]
MACRMLQTASIMVSESPKASLKAPMAHLPGKLPLNITELTPKARPMTHGVKPIVGPAAAEERERKRENIYHRREHKVLGRSIPTGSKLPAFTNHEDFRFGMSTLEEETAKEIMYPRQSVHDDDEIRRQYIISHWSYAPGQRRSYYGPNFVVPERSLESGRIHNDNDGNRTKEALYWTEERAKELQTIVVTKRLSDWQKRRRPEIGKVHDPIKDTIDHLQPEHVFGIRFRPDDYSVGDLIGYGKVAKESKKDADNVSEGDEPVLEEKNEESNDRRPPRPKSKLSEHLTPKITSIPQASLTTRETRTFGVPTIRQKRRPGYMKRLSDNTNYGDELDAKALLIPIPSNLYGEELLAKLRVELKNELRENAQEDSRRMNLMPAKVHAVQVV